MHTTLAPPPTATPQSRAAIPVHDSDAAADWQLSYRTLWKAVGCGLVADGFAWRYGVGLNLTAYLLTVVLATASVLRMRLGRVPAATTRLLVLSGVFALLLACRDSRELALLNTLAALSALAFAIAVAVPSPFPGIIAARVGDLLGILTRSAAASTLGAPVCVARLLPHIATLHRNTAVNIVRAGVLTAGVTIGFSALLALGDPVFRQATHWLVAWNGAVIVTHGVCTTLFAWPVIGMLGRSIAGPGSKPAPATTRVSVSLRPVDVISALASLNVVFLAFVVVQARAWFGGQQYVLATTGLSLADYARNGFFTLIITAALVLTVLLAFNAALGPDGLCISRAMRRLSGALLGLAGVVLVSSAVRMTLYMTAFGASTERVYAMAAIGWLAVVMPWFALTLLRNRPRHFAFGGLATAWGTILALNVLNPDALIARNHVARATRGQLHDNAYLVRQLSADAVPTIAAALHHTGTGSDAGSCASTDICAELPALRARWNTFNNNARVSNWTLSRWRAQRIIAADVRFPAIP